MPPVAPTTSPFNNHCLSPSVVLITGGASGIGFGIARECLKHGAKGLVLMGRREDVLKDACTQLNKEGLNNVSYIRGDVRNANDCTAAVAFTVSKYGYLSTLINSAAGNFLACAEDLSTKAFQTIMEIDAQGVWNMCSAAFPQLKAYAASGPGAEGNIINISANLHKPATWYQTPASAAKAAIDSMTRSLALEWGEYGIRVNGIAPGPIAGTPGMDKLSAGFKEEDLISAIPLRRWGTTLDIALTAVFLLSDAGKLAHGTTLCMDGGAVLWRPQIADRDVVRSFSRVTEKKHKSQTIGGPIVSKL